ncbi:Protein of unknown function DUF3455 [Lasallia pustulata]|uniref:Malate dehydrogenase n=1 Tax=Lasallia pustulata TaxID=136370 RepID=A0A1W5CS07_9LECA|nr:Protein of unknown function DUF3455 [Lasallia pustulata]
MASPSSRNPILLALLVLCTTLIHTSSARPWRRGPSPFPDFDLSSYCPTLSNGSSSLSPPMSNVTLEAVVFGRGVQNYTCNATDPTSAPTPIGAIATLFDATPLLPLLPPSAGEEILNLLPAFLVCFPLSSLTSSSLPILGVHYFDASGTPTFDLGSIGLLKAKKAQDITAPPGASKGPEDRGDGAVDWLRLTAKAGAGSRGLSEVYRVETAGGKSPPTCEGQPAAIEVQYAAQYWFYE